MNKLQLQESVIRALQSRLPEVQMIVLFGSRAREQATDKSDWDIGILVEPGAYEGFAQLKLQDTLLDVLKTKDSLTQADYDNNFEQQIIVERSLHILIESAVDINTHIVVSYQKSPPKTYRDFLKHAGSHR